MLTPLGAFLAQGFDVEYTLPDSDEPEADQRTRVSRRHLRPPTISCRALCSGLTTRPLSLQIDFKKPITRWADLRPTMLAMREEAKTALQVVRVPPFSRKRLHGTAAQPGLR